MFIVSFAKRFKKSEFIIQLHKLIWFGDGGAGYQIEHSNRVF